MSAAARISVARKTAFDVLERVDAGAFASDRLRGASKDLDARDAALAETLVFGVLRYQSQLDFLIAHFSGRAHKLDPEVRIALRMGMFQLRYLDRIPAHAAVAEAVELVKRARKRSAAPLVNAILRKVNRDPVRYPDLATELGIPPWMLERWQRQYGAEAAEGIARAALEEPEVFLNPQTGRQQDIGAQSIAPLLEIEPGMTALDLCAAPGNKTAQLIAAGARVTACDISFSRLASLPGDRVVLDATRPLPFGVKFDRILIDAPCSGTGTLARNPEIKWRLKPGDLAVFRARQREILAHALEFVKPGGVLVYATCSLEREENEEVVAAHAAAETHVRLPGRDPGDGFFAARIRIRA